MRSVSVARTILGLRWRLTLIFVACFVILVLGLGVLFRQTLDRVLQDNASELLVEEWSSLKSYMRFEKGGLTWVYDEEDPDEVSTVQRLRGVLMVTDSAGNVVEASGEYREVGLETTAEIRRILQSGKIEEKLRRDKEGYLYLFRSGPWIADSRQTYFVSIGRILDQDEYVAEEFSRKYYGVVPPLILGLAVLCWYLAGRALRPLDDVAKAAQSITSENLNLSIPRRGVNDELDHLIDAFNNMVERLEDSFNQIRQFSIDVSHELRTPLTAIRGQLEVALFTASTPEQFREVVAGAIEDVDRLAKVVRTLLHLSQAETGQVALTKEPIDLMALAADVIDQFQIPAEIANITLDADLSPALISGDRIQIERLISNLLSNAVKYTPQRGTVRLIVRQKDHGVELVVSDTGAGIPPEHLPHIFERFYRVPDGNRNPERGLGLGLSFVAWIAKAHGAKIHVESTVGQGSTFTVSFAAEPVGETAVEQAGDRIVA